MRLQRTRLPVAWELTRTLNLGGNATTVTESFRETWTLELGPSGMANIVSPRATVAVYFDNSPQADRPDVHWLGIKEGDLARLVGIDAMAASDLDENASVKATDRLVFFQLGRSDRYGTGINLNWADDKHYVVHIDIGTHVVL